MVKNRKYLWILVVIVILIIIDQAIKFQICNNLYNYSTNVIKGVLDLTYVENTQAAFGFGFNSRILLIIANIVIITILVNFIIYKKEELDKITLVSLSLILAGGISNLFDRMLKGFVVDYIDIRPLIKFAIFNFADICVVIGITIITTGVLIDIVKQRQKGSNEKIQSRKNR